jgi:4'-phosphopantetheinyl transferase
MGEFSEIRSKLASWAVPDGGLRLGDGEAHVWRCSLPECRDGLQRLSGLLSGEEQDRARRFMREEDRERFVVSHGALRDILGGYLGADPGGLLFSANEHGKPALAERRGGRELAFNLSHSQDLAVIAVTLERRIGVDVEYLRDLRDPGRLAERFFAEEERKYLESRPSGELMGAFFSCWTRKEAYVKGVGRGIGYSLSSFSVIAAEGGREDTVRDAKLPPGAPAWSLFGLPVGAGYAGAVAVEEDFTGVPSLFRDGAGRRVGEGDI